MNQRITLLTAACLGALSVALGAFGAHALKPMLMATGRLETYELAVRYQFYHTLALLAIGLLQEKFSGLKTAAAIMVTGIIIFSGSLYTLALLNQPVWGAVTPLGGAALIVAWMTMAWVIFRGKF